MSLRVFVLTNDTYLWAVSPFAHLFNQYWGEQQEVVLGCFKLPQARLPANFRVYQIDQLNYPAERWSDGFIKLITDFPDEYFIFMLEDYWLCRPVDVEGVYGLYAIMQTDPSILRFDLTDDRQFAGEAVDAGSFKHYDIVETPAETPYQMSLQAAIWCKSNLIQLLKYGKTAWETEIYTSPPDTMRVLGTRQRPVRYANAILKGKIDMGEINRIPEPHRSIVTRFIPVSMLNK